MPIRVGEQSFWKDPLALKVLAEMGEGFNRALAQAAREIAAAERLRAEQGDDAEDAASPSDGGHASSDDTT